MATRRTSNRSPRSTIPHDLPEARFIHRRRRTPHEMQRVLPVSGPPARNRSARHIEGTETKSAEELRDALDHGLAYRRVAHHPAAADQLGTRLELRFDEQHRLPERGCGGEET